MKHNNTYHYELLKGSSQAIVLHVSSIILSYIFMLLIAKHYGAEGMGIFALTFTYISIGAIFSKIFLNCFSIWSNGIGKNSFIPFSRNWIFVMCKYFALSKNNL